MSILGEEALRAYVFTSEKMTTATKKASTMKWSMDIFASLTTKLVINITPEEHLF
jgi:hypothetical protein